MTELEELQARLDALVAQQRAPAEPDNRSLVDQLMGGTAAGLSGVNRGMAAGIGMPMDLAGGTTNLAVDPINSLIEAMGGSFQIPRYEQGTAADLLAAGMDAPGQAMGLAGATQYQPQSDWEETIQNVGEDTGIGLGTLIPLAPAAGALARGGMVGRGLASMTEGLAARPGAFLGMETAAGVASGAGGEAANAYLGPGYEAVGELAGALGGAGAMMAARPAAMAGARAVEAISPGTPGITDIVGRDARQRAASVLQGVALDPAAAASRIEGYTPPDRLPVDYQPRTAQLAGDTGIDQLDREMLNRNPRAQDRNRLNRDVLSDAAGADVPTRDLDELATGIRGSLIDNLESFRTRADELYDPGRIDPSGAVELRAPRQQVRDPSTGEMVETIMPTPMTAASDEFGRISSEEAWDVSSPIRAIADAMAVPDRSYSAVINIRQRLNGLSQNAGGPQGKLNDMGAIRILREGIESALADMRADTPQFWGVSDGANVEDVPEYLFGALGRYREANDFYRENVEAYAGDIPSAIFGPDTIKAEETMARALARGTDGIAATQRAAVNPRTGEPVDQTMADILEYLMADRQRAMLTGSDQGRVGASALRRHLNRRGAVIRQVYGDEHLRTLQDIAEALGDIDAPFLRSQGTPNSSSMQNFEATRARQLAANAVGSVLQGTPVQGPIVSAARLGEGLVQSQMVRNQRAVDALVDRALLDPELATELLRMTTGPAEPGARVVDFLTQWANQELRSAGASDDPLPSGR